MPPAYILSSLSLSLSLSLFSLAFSLSLSLSLFLFLRRLHPLVPAYAEDDVADRGASHSPIHPCAHAPMRRISPRRLLERSEADDALQRDRIRRRRLSPGRPRAPPVEPPPIALAPHAPHTPRGVGRGGGRGGGRGRGPVHVGRHGHGSCGGFDDAHELALVDAAAHGKGEEGRIRYVVCTTIHTKRDICEYMREKKGGEI